MPTNKTWRLWSLHTLPYGTCRENILRLKRPKWQRFPVKFLALREWGARRQSLDSTKLLSIEVLSCWLWLWIWCGAGVCCYVCNANVHVSILHTRPLCTWRLCSSFVRVLFQSSLSPKGNKWLCWWPYKLALIASINELECYFLPLI